MREQFSGRSGPVARWLPPEERGLQQRAALTGELGAPLAWSCQDGQQCGDRSGLAPVTGCLSAKRVKHRVGIELKQPKEEVVLSGDGDSQVQTTASAARTAMPRRTRCGRCSTRSPSWRPRRTRRVTTMPDATHYTFRVAWSVEDGEHVATVALSAKPPNSM
jgi:hypothetical protein